MQRETIKMQKRIPVLFLFLVFVFLIVVTVAGVLSLFPQLISNNSSAIYTPQQIWMISFGLIVLLGMIGGLLIWFLGEKNTENNFNLIGNQDEGESSLIQNKSTPYFADLSTQLRFRYGRFWRRKVRLLWLTGEAHQIEQIAPGLTAQHWQEGEGIVLLWGESAILPANSEKIAALRQLCAAHPLDGIVQVIDGTRWPDPGQLDGILRQRQLTDSALGWQAPVYLWVLDSSQWSQQGRVTQPVGCLLADNATPESARAALQELIPGLRQQGMAQLMANNHHDFLLRLAQRFSCDWRQPLENLSIALLTGPSAMRLRGLMFSLPVVAASAGKHSWLPAAEWSALTEDCRQARGRSLGWGVRQIVPLSVLVVAVLWGMGTLLSLAVNYTQIVASDQKALIAADTSKELAVRLRNQLGLQQEIAYLQHRQTGGAPWYSRFGLNRDQALLVRLWPLYQKNNDNLMRNPAVERLQQSLSKLAQLPPGSAQRSELTKAAYDQLKAYLMMSRPEKIEAEFLSKILMESWPQRQGVPSGQWQDVGPKLIGFWAQNLPTHPQWQINTDRQLVAAVRQILIRQIGQRNGETALYQEILKQVAINYSDLTLNDLVGATDPSSLFTTDESIPGMFTRQAWEEQVRDLIEEQAKARRQEIDWVLTDNGQSTIADISPQALRERLTERYFNDFGNSWLNMVNSLRWIEAQSLTEAVGQLSLMSDNRQSPLVALMNTLVWQGKTGQKTEGLADSLVDSAKSLIKGSKGNKIRQAIEQTSGPQGPLDAYFSPLLSLIEGKEGDTRTGSLNFQSYLTRATQVRLKLQQVTHAADPQAMTQMLAQTVFQGKAVDLNDTRDYGSLMAASLGQAWNGFGQAVFVQPLELAWRQVLQPAAGSLNNKWQTMIVNEWNRAFAGRYPFSSTGSDASLPILAQYLRVDSGRLELFLKEQLGGILHKEGNRWVPNTMAGQGLRFDPHFLDSMNKLAQMGDIVFAQGDAGLRFELMAQPVTDVVRTHLTIDSQNLEYFNQMEGWQSFGWPGEGYYPGAQLSWRTVHSGMQLHSDIQGNWGLVRLLEKASVTPIDSSRYQLVWQTSDDLPLKYILRTELEQGPLVLLQLRDFSLPKQIFIDEPKEHAEITNALRDLDDEEVTEIL